MSLFKQIDTLLDYESEWFNFLNDYVYNDVICDIDIDIDIDMSKYNNYFQSFIRKKAREYIKGNFSLWKCAQIFKTYSIFSNTERERLNIKVQTLVKKFFIWKNKADKEANELLKEIEEEQLQKDLIKLDKQFKEVVSKSIKSNYYKIFYNYKIINY